MKQRRSDKGKAGGKRRRSDAKNMRALERLEHERTLFEAAATRVVHTALERAGLDGSDAPVVEIGSGGGQLRRWLPDRLLPAMVHTERDPAFVRKFQQAVPEAKVEVASAESLPYADESVAGVLGLCVLDVVDLKAVAREFHRVLRPGGSVVHFWDLSPNMKWLCEMEMRRGHVLLPDCFSEPVVRAELPRELQAALPPLDFLQDLISVPLDQLENLIALLRPRPTKLVDAAALDRLARYARWFSEPTGADTAHDDTWAKAAAEAARALAWLCADEREAYAVKRLLLNMWMILKQVRGGEKMPLELRRISSAQALSERLTEAFTALGMQVECRVRRARARLPRPSADDSPERERLRRARFVGRWLGTNAAAGSVPPADPDVLFSHEAPTEDELVVEAGILVLIALRR